MSRTGEFDVAHAQYRATRDAHGRTLAGDGCRCGHKATGVELHKHISSAVVPASRRLNDIVTRRTR